MSRLFLNGNLAEKARIAQTLASELLAELPEDIMSEVQEDLKCGLRGLHVAHHRLRSRDKDDEKPTNNGG